MAKKITETSLVETRIADTFQSKVANRIRDARSGMMLRDFAARCGVLPQTFAAYEREGGSLPGAALLKKICEASGVSADWILGLSEVKQRAQLRPVSASSVNAPATPDAARVLAEVARILAPAKAPVEERSVEDISRRLDAIEGAMSRLLSALQKR